MYVYKAKVIRVLDGDTYECQVDVGFQITITTKLRLAEIDTPETYRPKTEAERTHGKEATAFVSDLILDKTIVIRTNKSGKYGRYIAYVEIPDGRDLGTLLVENNLVKLSSY